MNFFPHERHKQIYLQLSLNLRGIISQRLVRTVEGGRAAAVEILLDSPRVKDLIHRAEVAELKEAMEKGAAIGMQTFDSHLFDLYKAGRINLETALRNADSQNNLRLKIKLSEEGLDEEQDSAFGGKKKKKGERSDSLALSLDM